MAVHSANEEALWTGKKSPVQRIRRSHGPGLSRPETGPFDMQCSKRSRTPDLSMCLGIVTLAFHGVTHGDAFLKVWLTDVDSLGHVGMIVYGHMLNENCRDAHICIICPTVAWLQAAHPRPEGADLCHFFPCGCHVISVDQCGCFLKAPCLVKNMQIRAVSTFRSHMGPPMSGFLKGRNP